MTVGLYVPRNSLLHRLSPEVKLLGMAIAGMGLFFVDSIAVLMLVLVLVLGLVAIARLPWLMIITQLRPVFWVLLIIAGLHALLDQWDTGIILALRFLTLMLLATLVTCTTRTADMVAAIARALEPLRRFGVRPEQFSLMVAIALRFIPVLLEQIRDIRDAQRARGIERPAITFLVPLLVRTFHLADSLTDAMDARCFDGDS